MIASFADLLEQLMRAEKERIDALGIKHRPTIGNTYEGLTAELLQNSLFSGLGLHIVRNSFIRLPDGQRSNEFDIMIIEGAGQLIPYTQEQYDVNFEQVIVVIQVKKRLNKAQIEEGYLNLKNVYDVTPLEQRPAYANKLFSDAFIRICRKRPFENRLYRSNFSNLTEEQVFHILNLESALPARIIFGYEGYTTEYGFREGFVKFIEENRSEPNDSKQGFGPMNYPDLIINGTFCLVKGNAMPYVGPMTDGQWPFYFSSAERPLLKMLEVIWTRLSYRFNLDASIFGDDLEIEGINGFLSGNIENLDGRLGWHFDYLHLNATDLSQAFEKKEWEPVFLTTEQYLVITYLCKNGSLCKSSINTEIREIGERVDISFLVQSLIQTELVYEISDGQLALLTEQCQCVYLPGNGFVAADNKTGQLTRWLQRRFPDQQFDV